MDSINVDKILALRKYKQQQFINSLMFYPLVGLTFVAFCTSPFWFPALYSCTKTCIYVSIPRILSFFFNVKSLFILGNLIVVFLLKDSKVQASDPSPHKKKDVDLNIKEHETQEVLTVGEPKQDEETKAEANKVAEQTLPCESEEVINHGGEKMEDVDDNALDDDEQAPDLSTSELNRRAEIFIAMVNKQIRLEADHEVLVSNCHL